MEKIRRNAAGIDIGAKNIYVYVEEKPVRSFETYTVDFNEAASYLVSEGVETVAMEATGVYWVILYEILEEKGLDVWLVDGRQTRQVPGRKTDVKDCQWIQQLHSYGLLNRCFIPDAQVKEIRYYQRLREDHIRSSVMHINHMQKALTEMNLRLTETLSQIHGASGLKIIEAILAGERSAEKLLRLCHRSIIKNKSEQVIKALKGHYTEQGIFALKQAYDAFMFYREQVRQCDEAIERSMEKINRHRENNTGKVAQSGRKPIRHNKPRINDLGDHLLKIFGGKDATVLPGFTDYSWLQVYAETGHDLSKWKTEKHFTSWLGLAPGQHHSGKKKKNKSKKHSPKAGQIFKNLAQSLIESKKISLGAFGRRLKGKRGAGIATKAAARKLATFYWRLMMKGTMYVEQGIKAYEEKIEQQKKKWLKKTASQMGFQLVENQ